MFEKKNPRFFQEFQNIFSWKNAQIFSPKIFFSKKIYYFFSGIFFPKRYELVLSILRFLGPAEQMAKNGVGFSAKISDFCSYQGLYNRVFI